MGAPWPRTAGRVQTAEFAESSELNSISCRRGRSDPCFAAETRAKLEGLLHKIPDIPLESKRFRELHRNARLVDTEPLEWRQALRGIVRTCRHLAGAAGGDMRPPAGWEARLCAGPGTSPKSSHPSRAGDQRGRRQTHRQARRRRRNALSPPRGACYQTMPQARRARPAQTRLSLAIANHARPRANLIQENIKLYPKFAPRSPVPIEAAKAETVQAPDDRHTPPTGVKGMQNSG